MSVNTSPATWAAGENPTAAKMNAEIRDFAIGVQAAWDTYTPTFTGLASTTSLVGRYRRVGKTISVQVSFLLGAAPTAAVKISLPVTASTAAGTVASAPLGVATGFRTGVAYRTGAVILDTSTTVAILSDNTAGPWSATIPATWATSDPWGLSFTYEGA